MTIEQGTNILLEIRIVIIKVKHVLNSLRDCVVRERLQMFHNVDKFSENLKR